jgi:hypothetical protein
MLIRGVDSAGAPQRTVYLPAGQMRGRIRHEAALSVMRDKPEKVKLEEAYMLALGQDLNSSYNSEKNFLQIADPEIQIKNIVYNLNLKNYYVVANIYQSRYLIAGDSDGTSDPYIKIKVGKQKLKTKVKNDTVNPVNKLLI